MVNVKESLRFSDVYVPSYDRYRTIFLLPLLLEDRSGIWNLNGSSMDLQTHFTFTNVELDL